LFSALSAENNIEMNSAPSAPRAKRAMNFIEFPAARTSPCHSDPSDKKIPMNIHLSRASNMAPPFYLLIQQKTPPAKTGGV
jgi:hypothetical protein